MNKKTFIASSVSLLLTVSIWTQIWPKCYQNLKPLSRRNTDFRMSNINDTNSLQTQPKFNHPLPIRPKTHLHHNLIRPGAFQRPILSYVYHLLSLDTWPSCGATAKVLIPVRDYQTCIALLVDQAPIGDFHSVADRGTGLKTRGWRVRGAYLLSCRQCLTLDYLTARTSAR